MRISLSIIAASFLFAGIGVASAQTTTSTTTTWTNDEGSTIREYSTTKKYNWVHDPSMRTEVGMELPDTVTVYPLPDTMKIQDPDRYSYTIINDRPVVVERSTRKVVHTWE